MKKIMVIAPHPDDETLGCGGTILKHKDQGDEVHWLIITSMEDIPEIAQETIKTRRKEIKDVSRAYDLDSVSELNLETAALDQYPLKKIISEIYSIFETIKPEVIYLPFQFDPHSDHRIVYEASIAASKSFRSPFIKKVRVYQTLSETEFSAEIEGDAFKPNLFIDISNYMEKKIEIMKLYVSEFHPHPFPRSEKSLIAQATLCGSTANCRYAEAFITIKEIE